MNANIINNQRSLIAVKSGLMCLVLLAALAVQSNANAGSYNITYSVTGSSSTGATPVTSYPMENFTVSVSGQPSGSLWATMTIQVTYTWMPSGAGDNPPSQIQVD